MHRKKCDLFRVPYYPVSGIHRGWGGAEKGTSSWNIRVDYCTSLLSQDMPYHFLTVCSSQIHSTHQAREILLKCKSACNSFAANVSVSEVWSIFPHHFWAPHSHFLSSGLIQCRETWMFHGQETASSGSNSASSQPGVTGGWAGLHNPRILVSNMKSWD